MPNTFKVSEVLTIIRKKLQLNRDEHQGMVLLAAGKHLMKHDAMLKEIYEKYKDPEDGFLYIVYAQEQIYGWTAVDPFWVRHDSFPCPHFRMSTTAHIAVLIR